MGFINPLTPSSLCRRLVNLGLKAKLFWQIVSLAWKQISTLSFLPSFLVPLKEKGGREEG